MVMFRTGENGVTQPLTLDDMRRAAQGNFESLSETPTERVNRAAWQQASSLASGIPNAGSSMYSFAQSPIAGSTYTPGYQSFRTATGLGTTYPPSSGLTSAGKYGGFYSATDLESAIAGQAMQTRDVMSQTYRDYANARYKQLESGLKQGMGDYASKKALASRSLRPEIKTMRDELLPSLRQYKEDINKWYVENAAPAEEYLATSQQIQATPLSQLAASIASQQYGMNPNLAQFKFADLDTKAYEFQRDRDYMANYGVPYQQFMDLQEQGQSAMDLETKQTEDAAIRAIEQTTGMNASAIRSFTGKSYNNIATQLSDQQTMYTWKGPDGEEGGNASTALAAAVKYLNAGKISEAENLIKSVEETNAELAQIIGAILGSNIKGKQKFQDYLMGAYSVYGQ